ncbi:MAG: hypothetical protein NW224_17385 [Leptolyngbyaceae cyanobacterium bins.302]|nr:hypothetical protein [Leptolyngbyaceae cyanobacterium bins.302]
MNLSDEFSLVAFGFANPLTGLAAILPEQSATWADLVTVLMVGLASAFALQVLLFCLGGAIAVSVMPLPFTPRVASKTASSQTLDSQTLDSQTSNLPISTFVGIGILGTVNLVLFVASFLAATFVHFSQPMTGAIAGIVLWSVYLGVIAWLSFTTVNAVAEGFFNVATVGLRRVVSSIVKIFSARNDEQALLQEKIALAVREEVEVAVHTLTQTLAEKQAPALPSLMLVHQPRAQVESATAESQLFTNEIPQTDITAVWQQLIDYLNQSDAKKLTPKQLDRTLKKLLAELQETLPEVATFPSINYKELTVSINQRQDLSERKKAKVIHQIQTGWETIAQNFQPKEIESNQSELSQTESNETGSETERLNSSAGRDSHSDLEATSEMDSPTISLPDAATLQALTEWLNQQVLAQVPTVLQRHWTEVVPLVAPMVNTVARSRLEDAIEVIKTSINSEQVKAQLQQLLATSQVQFADLNHAVGEQAEQLRDRVTTQAATMQESIQQGMQLRLNAIQVEIQDQLEATRKTVAVLLWWLFATVFTSGFSAALAGAIAAGVFDRS